MLVLAYGSLAVVTRMVRGGMIEVLKPLKASRKVLIHINNTNPILDDDSAERRELAAAGIEVAYDGLDITL